MRIVSVNHTAVSGGEGWLLSVFGTPPERTRALVPTHGGGLQAAVRELGIAVTTIAGIAGSLGHPCRSGRAF